MSFGILCKQQGCTSYASYRFTWPGQDEAHICKGHVPQLRGVANALGLHLHLVNLSLADHYGIAGMEGLAEQGKTPEEEA